ncbi:hypothetical protein GCM10022254_21340 [Actinomadura meridiana]|uniref:Secreted protein n=1 Tax=Actinomadura meridiana TaxID=559626 RepID=A0ABP8BX49_9ACTN
MTVPLARSVALAAALLALAACGTEGNGAGHPCTDVGSRPGLSLTVPPPEAARTASASLRVCWDDTCHEPRIELRSATWTVSKNCDADADASTVCSASSSPDAGKFGFANVQGLPTEPVQVTLRLRDVHGRTFFDRRVDLIPEATRPNGPGCDVGAPQAGLTIVHGEVTVL